MTRRIQAEPSAQVELRRMLKMASRINERQPAPHILSYKSDKAVSDSQNPQGYVPSNLPEGAVTPPTFNRLQDKGTYNGAELRPFDGRPGAMVAYSLPSRGFR
jgi:hypothetical protein